MGNASQKVITNNNGTLTEVASIKTSVGAADKDKLVATGNSGVIDPSLLNATPNSAGAGSAGKIPQLNEDGVLSDSVINATVAAAPNKVIKTDATGRLDPTVMPVGIGADTAVIAASEALAAGDLVNIWNSAGEAKVRKADASTAGKAAHGFVLTAVSAGADATVYFEGTNTQCSGLTPGDQFLSAVTAGAPTSAAPTAAGSVVQRVGFAISTTALNFDAGTPIVLA